MPRRMLRVVPVSCASIPCSETSLAFAGLLAALRRLLEDSQETAQRNQMLQVQKCLFLALLLTCSL